MSSGRMLDTVENVAAYYGPAVFVFFAACFGRPRATAACSGSPATVAPLSLSRAPLSSGPAAPDDRRLVRPPYYGVAVLLFFAACYGRVLWVAGDGRATHRDHGSA